MTGNVCDTLYVNFGKDRYHQQTKMYQWCENQFGPGRWIGEQYPKNWADMPNWTIHSMFGYTTFAFRNLEDHQWFILKWA